PWVAHLCRALCGKGGDVDFRSGQLPAQKPLESLHYKVLDSLQPAELIYPHVRPAAPSSPALSPIVRAQFPGAKLRRVVAHRPRSLRRPSLHPRHHGALRRLHLPFPAGDKSFSVSLLSPPPGSPHNKLLRLPGSASGLPKAFSLSPSDCSPAPGKRTAAACRCFPARPAKSLSASLRPWLPVPF